MGVYQLVLCGAISWKPLGVLKLFLVNIYLENSVKRLIDASKNAYRFIFNVSKSLYGKTEMCLQMDRCQTQKYRFWVSLRWLVGAIFKILYGDTWDQCEIYKMCHRCVMFWKMRPCCIEFGYQGIWMWVLEIYFCNIERCWFCRKYHLFILL